MDNKIREEFEKDWNFTCDSCDFWICCRAGSICIFRASNKGRKTINVYIIFSWICSNLYRYNLCA